MKTDKPKKAHALPTTEKAPATNSSDTYSKELEINVIPVTTDEKDKLHLKTEGGVKIVHIKKGGLGAIAGLQNNVLLLAINSHIIHNAHDLDRLIQVAKSRHRRYIAVSLWAYGRTILTTLDLQPEK